MKIVKFVKQAIGIIEHFRAQNFVPNTVSQFIGLDINLSKIYLLEFSRNFSKFKVENFAIVSLSEDVVVDHEFKNKASLIEGIKKAKEVVGSKTFNTAIAISGSSVVTKLIQVDEGLLENEIEARAQQEAKNSFSLAEEEIRVDFSILGPTQEKPSKIDVVLVAARKGLIEEYLSLFEESKFKVDIVDVDYFALANGCQFVLGEQGKEKTIAIFDANEKFLTLIVMHDFVVIYTREVILEKESIFLDFNTSAVGENDTKEDSSSLEALTKQMQHALHFFYSTSEYHNIDQIILSGKIAKISDIVQIVKEKVGIETCIINPFADLEINSALNKEELMKEASSFVTSVGLALRGFD